MIIYQQMERRSCLKATYALGPGMLFFPSGIFDPFIVEDQKTCDSQYVSVPKLRMVEHLLRPRGLA